MLNETHAPRRTPRSTTALNDAHLPALMMSLVHLTGDAAILAPTT